MSGRGETLDEESEVTNKAESLSFGQTLYDEEGSPVGTIRGLEKSGVFVTLREGIEALSIEHARSGQAFGEAELMWRCIECGEMGELNDGMPETCPGCGTKKENVMYWTED